MPYVEGGSLRHQLSERKRLATREAVAVARAIAAALAARAQLALDAIPPGQRLLQPFDDFGYPGHVPPWHHQRGIALARASRTIGWNSMSAFFQRPAKRP